VAAPSPSELSSWVAFAHELADAAGAVILPHFRAQLAVDNKDAAAFDPVTIADRDAETAMRALIEARFPDHGILGEEHGVKRGAGRCTWVLDPVDGTRGFITGLPTWGTLIGLEVDERPLLGIMEQPFVGDRFVGSPLGAELRSVSRAGQRLVALGTRPCASLREAILSTTSPDLFATGADRGAFDRLRSEVRLTRYGGDCYAYSMVALGLVDLVVESGLKPYDIVALVPIIERAGGVVTTWDGGSPRHGGRIVAAGDRRVHEAALERLNRG
jgi:histidinol phosphatase-like enzyme (inositol monophosphatase family)